MKLINSFRSFMNNSSRHLNVRPIRTIEQEMAESRARYNEYLRTTSDNFVAKRSNVTICDPHTMANDSYWKLRDNIDVINVLAKESGKHVKFQDARVITEGLEYDSDAAERALSSKILVSVQRDSDSLPLTKFIDVFRDPEVPLMKKVSDTLGELFTGVKGANFDDRLPVK